MYLKLKELLSDYNLKLVYMEMEESGFYYPKPRIVFLNEKLHEDRAEAFHLAHELGHFIASHYKYTTLYDSRSNTFHSKFEAEANKIAIIILLNIFVENELTDESQFKLDNFMSFYSINSNLRTECFDVCHSYFKKNYSYAQ